MSVWRTDDVVTYDVMRNSATALTARLLRSVEVDPRAIDRIRPEVAAWWDAVLTVDAYDRAAVAELAARIDTRSHELDGETS